MNNSRILLAAALAAVTLSASAAFAADAMPAADASANAAVTTPAASMDHKTTIVKKHHKKVKKVEAKAEVKADAAK